MYEISVLNVDLWEPAKKVNRNRLRNSLSLHTKFMSCAGAFRWETQNLIEKRIQLPVSRKNTFLGSTVQHITTLTLTVFTMKV